MSREIHCHFSFPHSLLAPLLPPLTLFFPASPPSSSPLPSPTPQANDYMNVILHTLAHIPPFRDYFLRTENYSHIKPPPGDQTFILGGWVECWCVECGCVECGWVECWCVECGWVECGWVGCGWLVSLLLFPFTFLYCKRE